MKFRSPNKTPIRVASTTGHIAIVGPEWRELPEQLHVEAVTKGCICDQEFRSPVDPTLDPYADGPRNGMQTGGEKALIRAALKQMLIDRGERPHLPISVDDQQDARFTPDNIPRTEYVSQIAGIQVNKTDVLEAWNDLRSEALKTPEPKPTQQEKAREAGKAAAAKKADSTKAAA